MWVSWQLARKHSTTVKRPTLFLQLVQWMFQQQHLFHSVHGSEKLVLTDDGRCDSPGFNVKYGCTVSRISTLTTILRSNWYSWTIIFAYLRKDLFRGTEELPWPYLFKYYFKRETSVIWFHLFDVFFTGYCSCPKTHTKKKILKNWGKDSSYWPLNFPAWFISGKD